MKYSQLSKSLKRSGVVESIRSYQHIIEKFEDGSISIDNKTSEFKNLEEARSYIKNKQYSKNLEQKISKQIYEELSENRIANIIREHHKIKVTDTLIESYIDLASSKIFTVDPVVQEIRKLNKLDVIIENKIHYELLDGSIVAINETTLSILNNLLQNQKEIIDYMRESKDNFLNVIERIEE